MSVVHPSHRAQIEVAHGVRWERLAAAPDSTCSFVQIVYEPESSATELGETFIHEGYENGYILSGELQVTIGGETFMLSAGDSIGFDSSIPHVLRNVGDVTVEGIWVNHGSYCDAARARARNT